MSTHKDFDKICCVILAFTLILALLFVNAEHFGIQKSSTIMGYEKTLFDTSKIHTINIIMNDWDGFTGNCKSEEYYDCTIVIDNEAYQNIAIRGKGNTSLSHVDNGRYSYKIEFDHYDPTNTYHGLDKLCLNNIIQDNTYMKDYLAYQMMRKMGVAAPLCSYAYLTVNGEDWGLYLAVEGVEESFLQRNFGKDYGKLYKPDSMRMGGGRGNGEKFDMDTFLNDSESENADAPAGHQIPSGQMQGGMMPPSPPGGLELPDGGMAQDGHGMMNSSDDVLLKYIDDNAESYANIFDHAKTDISEADKRRLIESLKALSSGEYLDGTVDIDAVIRYFVVHNFVLNFDSYTGSMIHNYYLYEEDGQMQMIPWDYNLAFGGFQSMDSAETLVNYPIDSPVSGSSVDDRPMIAWIFANEEYTALYHQRFAEFLSEYFDSGYFEEMIDGVTDMIAPYVEKDPTKFCTYDEFKTGIATLKTFCLLRAESVRGQLAGTIGSTSDTQKAETRIPAGDIQVNDMGSMENTSGVDHMQEPQGGENRWIPNEDRLDSGKMPSEELQSTDNSIGGQDPMRQIPGGQTQGDTPPGFSNGESGNQNRFDRQMQRPDGMRQNTMQGQRSLSVTSWIMVGAVVLVFALGIVFAVTYKRRK